MSDPFARASDRDGGHDSLFWPRKRVDQHPNLRLVRYTMEEITPWAIKDPVRMGTIVAKWLGALSIVLTVGYDGLIDRAKLGKLKVEFSEELCFGLPRFPWQKLAEKERAYFNTYEKIFSYCRNAFAHGNIQLVPGQLVTGTINGVVQTYTGVDFVGVIIWNGKKTDSNRRVKQLGLDFEDMVALTVAAANLCENRNYWTQSALSWSLADVDAEHGLLPARMDLRIIPGEPFELKIALYEPIDIEDIGETIDPNIPQ